MRIIILNSMRLMASRRRIMMIVRNFITVTIILFYFLPLFAQPGSVAVSKTDARPNVILILADDMGVGDMSSSNGGMSRTPVLDALRKESVWFTQAYAGSAVCAPSRASLLTGRFPQRTGVVDLDMQKFPSLTNLASGEVTIADVFQQNGYSTGLVGKWHLGIRQENHPMKRGFGEFAGFRGFDVKTYFNYRLDINGTYQNYDSQYLTDNLTEHAIQFISKHKNDPFFLHLAYYSPHRPLGAPEDLVDYYQRKGYDLKTSKIYAMIEVMDKGIGRMLDELNRLGLRKKTIIIFGSDNGPDPLTGQRFNQQLYGRKYSVNEGGIRIPLMFNWKGRLAARNISQVAGLIDIFPTLVDICRLKISPELIKRLDGGSLSRVLSGQQDTTLPVARYWQWNRGVPYYSHNAAMREGSWKLVRPMVTREIVDSASTLKPMLFDLSRDSTESTDVSADNPGVFERMKVMLEDWSRKVEADRLKATSHSVY